MDCDYDDDDSEDEVVKNCIEQSMQHDTNGWRVREDNDDDEEDDDGSFRSAEEGTDEIDGGGGSGDGDNASKEEDHEDEDNSGDCDFHYAGRYPTLQEIFPGIHNDVLTRLGATKISEKAHPQVWPHWKGYCASIGCRPFVKQNVGLGLFDHQKRDETTGFL